MTFSVEKVQSESLHLAATPNTLSSLVKTGTHPDTFKPLSLFRKFNDAVKNCPEAKKTPPVYHQVFIFKLEVPIKTDLIQKVKGLPTQEEYFITPQIKTEWIKSVLLYSERSQNLFLRLLDGKFILPLFIKPEEFKLENEKKDIPSESEEKQISSSLKVEKGSNTQTARIIERQGDLLQSKMQTLVNTVNCVGVMGKGVALAFKKNYPDMFKEYAKRCKQKLIQPGIPDLYCVSKTKMIINFPTKNTWQANSKLEWIETGLSILAQKVSEWGITSLAIPPLGCGNGGLKWELVRPLIYKYLDPLDIEIEIYTPLSTAIKKRKASF